MKKNQLSKALENCAARQEKLEARLEDIGKQITTYEPNELSYFTAGFNAMLNQRSAKIKISDSVFYPADILRQMDPTAYDNALWDFIVSLEWEVITDLDPDAYKLQEEFDRTENTIHSLEYHQQELSDALEEFE